MKNTILTLALIAITSPVLAEEKAESIEGFRVGIGYTSASIGGSVTPSGYTITAGYDVNKVLGISGSYTNVKESQGTYSFEGSSIGADLDIGYTFGNPNRVTTKVYGIVGLNKTSMEESVSNYYYRYTATLDEMFVRVGVGARVTFNNNLGISAQYVENYWVDNSNASYSQVDLIASYKF